MHQLGTQVQSLCGGWSAHKFGELKCISAWRSQFMSRLRISITSVFSTVKKDILLRAKDKTKLCIYDVTIISKLPHRILWKQSAEFAGFFLHTFELTLFFPHGSCLLSPLEFRLKQTNQPTRTKPNRKSLKKNYLYQKTTISCENPPRRKCKK